MQEARRIEAAMGLVLDCEHLRLAFQSLYDGIGEATEASMNNAAFFGCNLWSNLIARGAYLPALDQTIDRLPPDAFGSVTSSSHFASLMKDWAAFGAPNLFQAYLMFKKMALEAGWKPSQVNSFLVVGLRMEEMMMGGPVIPENAPSFDELDQSSLNAREIRVVEWMSQTPAHGA